MQEIKKVIIKPAKFTAAENDATCGFQKIIKAVKKICAISPQIENKKTAACEL